MRLKLKTNIPGHRYGAIVPAEKLGEDFARQLLDGDLAEEVEDEAPADPVEALLHEVFELEEQIDGAVNRRARVVLGLDGLDGEDRKRVEAALAPASRVRPELFGLGELPDGAQTVAEQAARIASLEADLAEAQRSVIAGSERIALLEAELASAQAAALAATNNPPPPAEPSGDAAEASSSAAELDAPAPAQPAGKSSGAAKAKRAEG